MGCHDLGIRKAKDEVRDHVLADRTFSKAVRDAVEALYPADRGDGRGARRATARSSPTPWPTAGLGVRDAEGKLVLDADGNARFPNLNGIEMINALAKRYEDDVELKLAAAEFGQSKDEFVESIAGAGDPGRDAPRPPPRPGDGAARHLREAVHRRWSTTSPISKSSTSPISAASARRPCKRPVGDAADLRPVAGLRPLELQGRRTSSIFTVTSEEDCFLTLINVDQKGTATVLYPNQFEKDNHIKAAADLTSRRPTRHSSSALPIRAPRR